jgi:hypothetical protein
MEPIKLVAALDAPLKRSLTIVPIRKTLQTSAKSTAIIMGSMAEKLAKE